MPIRTLISSGLFLLLIACQPAFAAAYPTQPLDVGHQASPSFDVYSVEHGLSPEIWKSLGVDSDGFVWAGSASTVARFDGYRWQAHEVPGANSLVRSFARDAEGTLWAMFDGEGMAHYDGERWALDADFPEPEGLYPHINALGEKELWLTYRDGLAKVVNGRWQADPANSNKTARVIAVGWTKSMFGQARQWIARQDQGGLWYREVRQPGEYGPWQRAPFKATDSMAFTDLQRSESEGREELWVMAYTTGLVRISEQGLDVWRAFDSCTSRQMAGPPAPALPDGGCRPAQLPSEAIYQAVVTYDDDDTRNLWVATRAGLVQIRGEQIYHYSRRHGLPNDAVRGLMLQKVDDVDVLWVATEGGIARTAITETAWQTVSHLGATENGTFGVLLEPDGDGGERLWVGSSQRGLRLLENGHWRSFRVEDGTLPANSIRAMWRVPDADGNPWRSIAFDRGRLYRINEDEQFEELATSIEQRADVFVDDVIAVEGENGTHEILVATHGDGVHRLRNGLWQRLPMPPGLTRWRVRELLGYVDAEGVRWLWALGDDGLFLQSAGDGWRHVELDVPEKPLSLLSGAIFRFGQSPQLWLASAGNGVLRLAIEQPTSPQLVPDDDLPAPPDQTVYSIKQDGDGRIYICTNNGVQQLQAIESGGYLSRVFRRSDGLVHDECNSNAQFIDRFNRYWVGTLGGLSVYDPAARTPRSAATAKAIHLTQIFMNGRPQPVPFEQQLVVPAGVREIRLDFALLSGLKEHENRYRSQLIGYESQPLSWSFSHSRVFTDLDPGDYRLRVEAISHSGANGLPLEMAVHVQGYWWQNRWLHWLILALIVVFTVAIFLWQNRVQRIRQQVLRDTVAERTSELRRANKRLTDLSNKDALTELANRRRWMAVMQKELDRAREQQRPIGLLMVDVDHFKHYNDNHGHVAGDVALKTIAQALAKSTRKQDLVARLGGEEFACLVIDADLENLTAIAERMRTSVAAKRPRELGNDREKLTISVGLLMRVPGTHDTVSTLLKDCDAALYRAKESGRNRVCLFD
jgi:diguanylate cyclase (GGDEF)-like protein